MGKRSKSSNSIVDKTNQKKVKKLKSEQVDENSTTKFEILENIPFHKTVETHQRTDDSPSNEVKESTSNDAKSALKSKKKKKRTRNKGDLETSKTIDDLETSRNITSTDDVVESETVNQFTDLANKKVKTKKVNKKHEPVKNKKTIFTDADDEPVKVENKNKKSKRNKKTDLSQEDEVNDEDINKFCDELTEEDNVQYNNWVELIEAKLKSNKNKSN